MPDIRTCEEYVLARVLALENQVERQESLIEDLSTSLQTARNRYINLYSHIKDRLSVAAGGSDDTMWVEFDNVWERYEADEFQWLVNEFGLTIPSEVLQERHNKEKEKENISNGEEV